MNASDVRQSLYQTIENEITTTADSTVLDLFAVDNSCNAFAITLYIENITKNDFITITFTNGEVKTGATGDSVPYYYINQASITSDADSYTFYRKSDTEKKYYLESDALKSSDLVIRKEIKFGTFSKLLTTISSETVSSYENLVSIAEDTSNISNGSFIVAGDTTYVNKLLPKSTNAGVIGDSTNSFENSYLKNIYTNNINSLSGSSVTIDSPVSITGKLSLTGDLDLTYHNLLNVTSLINGDYKHRIDFGKSEVNEMDFFESGGLFKFYHTQNDTSTRPSGNPIFQISNNEIKTQNVIPWSNNEYNIGSEDFKYKNAYFSGEIFAPNFSLTNSGISLGASSAPVTINGELKTTSNVNASASAVTVGSLTSNGAVTLSSGVTINGTSNTISGTTTISGALTLNNSLTANGSVTLGSDTNDTITIKSNVIATDRTITAGTFSGKLTGNASTATKLTNARDLWGQSFDGTKNISGDISSTGDITPSANGSSSIGSTSLKYKNGYFSGNLSAGSITSDSISADSITSPSITVGGVGGTNFSGVLPKTGGTSDIDSVDNIFTYSNSDNL